MKKLTIFIIGLLIAGNLFCQLRPESGILYSPYGTDTSYFIPLYNTGPWGINFTYKNFDAADAVLDLGVTMHPDSLVFDRLDNASLPFTLADSTVSFEKQSFPFRYLVVKITGNSVTPALPIYYWLWKDF